MIHVTNCRRLPYNVWKGRFTEYVSYVNWFVPPLSSDLIEHLFQKLSLSHRTKLEMGLVAVQRRVKTLKKESFADGQ